MKALPEHPGHVQIGIFAGDKGYERHHHDRKVKQLPSVAEVSLDS